MEKTAVPLYMITDLNSDFFQDRPIGPGIATNLRF